MRRLLEWLIRRGWLRPYRKGHLFHGDGSLYMGRWSVFESRWLSCRLHHIATADFDRHLHDHPWDFFSIVLCGGYAEVRPILTEPCFLGSPPESGEDMRREAAYTVLRMAGAMAFRRATDRHQVKVVMPDTYTLFIYGPKRQWWGFFTPYGKVYYEDYPSCHAAMESGGRVIEERT